MIDIRKRWRLTIVIAAIIGILAIIHLCTPVQQITLLNSHATFQRKPASATPLASDRLVFLDIEDFGYSVTARPLCDVCSYHFFDIDKGRLYLTEGSFPDVPLEIGPGTRIAVNMRRSTTEVNDSRHPHVIDRIPWTYTSVGAPIWTDSEPPYTNRTNPWLRHHATIAKIAQNGTVILTIGRKHVLLKPGGKVKIERSTGFWRSTVTINHMGIFAKVKIRKSKGLHVNTN